jgi:hypothetical protein
MTQFRAEKLALAHISTWGPLTWNFSADFVAAERPRIRIRMLQAWRQSIPQQRPSCSGAGLGDANGSNCPEAFTCFVPAH